MGQEQKPIEVKMRDGTTRDGVATGNNAAWLCPCGRELPLVGRTFESEPKPNQVVNCPDCDKVYHLYPEVGKEGRRFQTAVEYVRECKQP